MSSGGNSGGTVHVAAPSAVAARRSPGSLQRSPFAIQELLGLAEPSRPLYPAPPSAAPLGHAPPPPPPPHAHPMSVAASRVAYFNAQAAVAAAFLPQHAPLALHGAPPPGNSF